MGPHVISHQIIKMKLNKKFLKVYTSDGSHVISCKIIKRKLNKTFAKVCTSHGSQCDFT